MQLCIGNAFANDASEKLNLEHVVNLCKVEDSSAEEYRRVSDEALKISEAGQYELAAVCYIGLINGGQEYFWDLEEISLNYSKADMCDEAQEFANRYEKFMRKFWIEKSDHSVASNYELFEEKDWADFSNRPAIVTPYDDVNDSRFKSINKAIRDCVERTGETEHNKSLNTDASDAGAG